MALSEQQQERMNRMGIRPGDLEFRFSRSSGPGGQNVNKVSTAVEVLHRGTGISVRVQDSRSQSMNRSLAVDRLLNEIHRRRVLVREEAVSRREKERRRKRPRPRGLKERILESKRHRSAVKKNRGESFGD